ncbi:hypothetical protein Taro_001176, partial [Colocasia esculenta]|nr:hypothetical protein [Colocasia esculenta]
FVMDIYKAVGREVDKDIIAQIPLHVPKLTGAWFNREEVDKFDEEVRLFLAQNKDNVTSEVDLPDMKEEEMEKEQKPVKTASSRKRGYTTCHHVYAMEEGRRICVAWNDIGQPVRPGPKQQQIWNIYDGTCSGQQWDKVAARNDTYTQVLGPDRPGRVSGVGPGPTPTSMWGNESKEALRSENRLLMQRMEELETSMAEKFAKMESMIRGSQAKNDGKCAPSAHVDVHMTSAVEGQAVDQDVKCIIDCGDISKGHMRGECPELKRKLIKKKFEYKKPSAMMATWSDEDEDEDERDQDESDDEDEEIKCLMARSDDSNEVNASFESYTVEEWEEA